jgi:hypothetical protein
LKFSLKLIIGNDAHNSSDYSHDIDLCLVQAEPKEKTATEASNRAARRLRGSAKAKASAAASHYR